MQSIRFSLSPSQFANISICISSCISDPLPSIQFLIFFNWFDYKRMSYEKKLYPIWAEFIGWIMATIPIVIIVAMGAWKFIRAPKDKSMREVSQQGNSFAASGFLKVFFLKIIIYCIMCVSSMQKRGLSCRLNFLVRCFLSKNI